MATMQVETYEVPEIAGIDGEPENEAEAIALIEKMSLDGQRLLVNRDKGERFPYRPMTVEEFKVYKALLTEHVEIKKYKDAPIPLRVLQVAAHASEVMMGGKLAFAEIEVWSAKSAEIKDPILVGKHMKDSYNYTYYLLARWGDVLLPLDECRKLAVKIRFNEIRAAITKIATKAQARLAALTETDDVLDRSVPSCYDLA